MHCQPLCEVGNRCLGTGICRNLCQRRIRIHRRNVQDVAAVAADHLSGKCLGRDQRSDEVEVEDKLNTALVEIEETLCICFNIAQLEVFLIRCGPGIVSTGTVEQNIARSKICQNLICYCIARIFIQYIACIGLGTAAFFDDFLCESVCCFIVQIQQRNLCACSCQYLGKGATSYTAGTGNDCDFTAQIRIDYICFHFYIPLVLAFSIASQSPLIYVAPRALSYRP